MSNWLKYCQHHRVKALGKRKLYYGIIKMILSAMNESICEWEVLVEMLSGSGSTYAYGNAFLDGREQGLLLIQKNDFLDLSYLYLMLVYIS